MSELTKLEQTLVDHPELSPMKATQIEVMKVAEPTLRNALLALVDLAVYAADGEAPEVVRARNAYEAAKDASKKAEAKGQSKAPPAK